MDLKTHRISIRLTEDEKAAFIKIAENKGAPFSRLLRKMIRECINGDIDLLEDEWVLFRAALRQLIGSANNLNQLVKSIHQGKCKILRDQNIKPILETQKDVLALKKALENQIIKTKQRWVKHHAKGNR